LSKEEREQGKRWVEGEIRRVASERGLQLLDPIEWKVDFDRSVYWVRIVAGEQEKLWKFSYEQLEDSVNDKRVRRELEKAISFVIPDGPERNVSDVSSTFEDRQWHTGEPVSRVVAIEPKHLLRVFLCHSKVDKDRVHELYKRLVADGIGPWFDEEDLLPGQDWEAVIKKAVENSDVVLVCLSKTSVARRGFAQKEIKLALDVADQQPEGAIYLIPIKLEECEIPDRLKKWQWVEFFNPKGYQKLLSALHSRAVDVGIQFPSTPNEDEGETRKSAAIAKFVSSRNFRDAKLNFAQIGEFDQLSKEQVERILLGAITNDQIYQPAEVRRLVNQFFAVHGYLASSSTRERFLKLFSS
jgi:hypothetical protein